MPVAHEYTAVLVDVAASMLHGSTDTALLATVIRLIADRRNSQPATRCKVCQILSSPRPVERSVALMQVSRLCYWSIFRDGTTIVTPHLVPLCNGL